MTSSPRTAWIQEFYQAYQKDQDTARFTRQVSQRYSIGTLERLTRHEVRELRRAAVLALGILGNYDSNAVLGRCLIDDDRVVRTLAENGIRSLWRRADNEDVQSRLRKIIRLNSSARYRTAIDAATALITLAPDCAEGWNQRAIAHYNLNQYAESIRDCHQALEINPYHFDAATGMGQCCLQINDPAMALDCFRRALRLNPGLEGVRAGADYLERSLKKSKDSHSADQ